MPVVYRELTSGTDFGSGRDPPQRGSRRPALLSGPRQPLTERRLSPGSPAASALERDRQRGVPSLAPPVGARRRCGLPAGGSSGQRRRGLPAPGTAATSPSGRGRRARPSKRDEGAQR